MVRALDVDTQAAIRDRRQLVIRNFVLVSKGEDAWGFTDFGEDVTLNVVDAVTGSSTSRDYAGDNAPILSIDPIPMKIGLEVNTIEVVLNALQPAVEAMLRGADIRNGVVQIHRGYLDPQTMLLVAPPRARFLGRVNEAPLQTGAADGQGAGTLRVVGATRELSRTNPAKRSDEQQRLRGGDRLRRYGGITSWDYWWGEKGSED